MFEITPNKILVKRCLKEEEKGIISCLIGDKSHEDDAGFPVMIWSRRCNIDTDNQDKPLLMGW